MNNINQQQSSAWFTKLRDEFLDQLEKIELEYANHYNILPASFKKKSWSRSGGGGGQMSIMHGNVFEKVGVNISTVHGILSEDFRKEVKGAEGSGQFFATGISFVAHMHSPLIPAAHFNTRYIQTSKSWFGGGADLTPTYPEDAETIFFHDGLKAVCDKHNQNYYSQFKQQCDEYFFLKHRDEARGVGGIFFDYINTGNFDNDFAFIQDLGEAFLAQYSKIVNKKIHAKWDAEQKEEQLIKRGKYVEFNLLYDRGTKFGLMTEGNIEAIFMSLPPVAKWT